MRLYRNPEWRRFLLTAGAIILMASAGAFRWGAAYACYVVAVCLVLLAVFWNLTRKRYERLEQLSSQLEEILYGNDSLAFLPDEEGELAVLSDRIYKMTIRLREQTEQLQEEKAYLKDSLADISHQIRTPLTASRLVLQKLRNPSLTEPERRTLLMEEEQLLSRVERLMEMLLKLARLESGTVELEKKTISVNEVVQKALEPLKILLDIKGIEVDAELPGQICFEGDLLWSVEAVENLLKNCLEHTPDGGKLIISAEENPIFLGMTIRDTGRGFSEEDIPHLFERFYRGKDSAVSGTGIGLALAEMIIRRQNGTIRAANHPEGGAGFFIRIYREAV